MADQATALSTDSATLTPKFDQLAPDYESLFPTKQQFDKAQSDIIDLTKHKMAQEDAAQAQFEKRDAADRAMMMRAFEAQGAEIKDLKPWDAQKELDKRTTPLWEQWGSPAVFAANLLSAFTHMPMTNALNASAAAMNAIQKGDLESYNRAMDAWKQNSELAQKRAALEHTQYEEIEHLRQTNLAEWRAKASAVAARFNDQRGLALLANGMDPEFLQVKEAIPQSMAKMAEAQDKITQQQLKINVLNGLPDGKGGYIGGDPDWRSGDPRRMKAALDRVNAGQLNMEQRAFEQFSKEHPDATFEEQVAALKEIKQAEYPYSGNLSLSKLQATAIADRAAEIKKEHPGIAESEAIERAGSEIRPAFMQSRSAIGMYMQKYAVEHPHATSDEVKAAAQKYTTQITAQNRFLSGPQGNTIRSLNVVVSHLQTMQDLATALQNNDVVAFNRIAQSWAEQTGQAAPTNFDTAKQIVGAEIIKALGVAGAGSEAERMTAANDFSRAKSPQQIAGAIETAKKLLVGQLSGLRRQYTASTGLPVSTFDEMLEPETRSFFGDEDKRGAESIIHYVRRPDGTLGPAQ